MLEELELETILDLKLESENVCNNYEDSQKLVCNCLNLNFLPNSLWFSDFTIVQRKLHFRLLYAVSR